MKPKRASIRPRLIIRLRYVIALWIYYSAQIFLLGAEFTKVYAHHHGSQKPVPQAADMTLGNGDDGVPPPARTNIDY